MSKQTPRPSLDAVATAAVGKAAKAIERIPAPLRGLAVSLGTGPIIGMIAGFMLLFGGIFLSVAWTMAVQPWFDATHYAGFKQPVSGTLVDAWTTLDFDPDSMREDRLRWFAFAKISSCAIVDYPAGTQTLRRAFCGNRFTFSDDMTLHDWTTLAPDVPFGFERDEKNFAVEQMRMSAEAAHWLTSHPPYSVFRAADPPPKTAYEALQDQFDRPLDVALASWTHPMPMVPIVFDPAHPDDAMPAGYVASRREGPWIGAMIVGAVIALLGLWVWRAGIIVLVGERKPAVIWSIALLPLLAMPWWGDVLPWLLRRVDRDWSDVASAMLDDITRVTRLTAGEPRDALFADGERIEWHLDRGRYADTFGRIPFRAPQPMPATAEAARGALVAQTTAYVATLDVAAKAVLFERLRAMKKGGLDNVQSLFLTAAERTLRDPESGAARVAAKHFLNDEDGGKYALDTLDAMENSEAAKR